MTLVLATLGMALAGFSAGNLVVIAIDGGAGLVTVLPWAALGLSGSLLTVLAAALSWRLGP